MGRVTTIQIQSRLSATMSTSSLEWAGGPAHRSILKNVEPEGFCSEKTDNGATYPGFGSGWGGDRDLLPVLLVNEDVQTGHT